MVLKTMLLSFFIHARSRSDCRRRSLGSREREACRLSTHRDESTLLAEFIRDLLAMNDTGSNGTGELAPSTWFPLYRVKFTVLQQ